MRILSHYFADEAGDTTLFGRFGKVLADTDAVTRFFMVARLEADDLGAPQADMDALRTEFLAALATDLHRLNEVFP